LKKKFKKIELKRMRIKIDIKRKCNQMLRDEIKKKSQSRKVQEKKQLTIKRIRIRFDIKIKCQRWN